MPITLQKKSFNTERQLYEFNILADGKAVGLAQLRLKASKAADMPEGFESNIYYEIDPERRGRGYATAALRELLKFAAKHGLKTVFASVNESNIASKTVIERCGGDLVATGQTTSGQKVLKYDLDTSAMNDLYDVGPDKPMGYLPKSIITDSEGQSIPDAIKQLESRGLKCLIVEEADGGNVASGALVVYDERALTKLLQDNLEILGKNHWPTDAYGFALRTAKESVSNKDLYKLIAYAFADKRPEFQRPA